ADRGNQRRLLPAGRGAGQCDRQIDAAAQDFGPGHQGLGRESQPAAGGPRRDRLTLGDSLSDAWKGNEEAGFKTPLKKLRGIAAIYPNYIQIVARADSGIKTLADLKGKKISVGAPKSGTELNARAVLHAAGIEYKDFAKVEYLPFGESVELMKNRQIDVTLQSAGLGVSSLRDLAASVPIVVVPIPEEAVKKIGDPAYIGAVIPANTYN